MENNNYQTILNQLQQDKEFSTPVVNPSPIEALPVSLPLKKAIMINLSRIVLKNENDLQPSKPTSRELIYQKLQLPHVIYYLQILDKECRDLHNELITNFLNFILNHQAHAFKGFDKFLKTLTSFVSNYEAAMQPEIDLNISIYRKKNDVLPTEINNIDFDAIDINNTGYLEELEAMEINQRHQFHNIFEFILNQATMHPLHLSAFTKYLEHLDNNKLYSSELLLLLFENFKYLKNLIVINNQTLSSEELLRLAQEIKLTLLNLNACIIKPFAGLANYEFLNAIILTNEKNLKKFQTKISGDTQPCLPSNCSVFKELNSLAALTKMIFMEALVSYITAFKDEKRIKFILSNSINFNELTIIDAYVRHNDILKKYSYPKIVEQPHYGRCLFALILDLVKISNDPNFLTQEDIDVLSDNLKFIPNISANLWEMKNRKASLHVIKTSLSSNNIKLLLQLDVLLNLFNLSKLNLSPEFFRFLFKHCKLFFQTIPKITMQLDLIKEVLISFNKQFNTLPNLVFTKLVCMLVLTPHHWKEYKILEPKTNYELFIFFQKYCLFKQDLMEWNQIISNQYPDDTHDEERNFKPSMKI